MRNSPQQQKQHNNNNNHIPKTMIAHDQKYDKIDCLLSKLKSIHKKKFSKK